MIESANRVFMGLYSERDCPLRSQTREAMLIPIVTGPARARAARGVNRHPSEHQKMELWGKTSMVPSDHQLGWWQAPNPSGLDSFTSKVKGL